MRYAASLCFKSILNISILQIALPGTRDAKMLPHYLTTPGSILVEVDHQVVLNNWYGICATKAYQQLPEIGQGLYLGKVMPDINQGSF